MQKDGQGVGATQGRDQLAPTIRFRLTGELIDPSNHATVRYSLPRARCTFRDRLGHLGGIWAGSFWETADDAARVRITFYKSGVVGDDRGFCHASRRGYDPRRGKQSYPVLYLCWPR